MGIREPGLEQRYRVEKINDLAGKHDRCRYFVLDPQHDPAAREALRTYAAEMFSASNDTLALALALELFDWADQCTPKDGS